MFFLKYSNYCFLTHTNNLFHTTSEIHRNLKTWSLPGHYSKKLTPRNNPVPKGGAIRINQNSQSAVSNKPRWRRPSAFGVGRTVTLTILQPSHFTILYIEAKGTYRSVLLLLALFVERWMCSYTYREGTERRPMYLGRWQRSSLPNLRPLLTSLPVPLIYGNKPKELATGGHYHVNIINNIRVKKISGVFGKDCLSWKEIVSARGVSEGVQATILSSVATVLFS